MSESVIDANSSQRLTLRRPDDWHVHLRDGTMLASVVNYTARQFARAIVMPNLSPPITTLNPNIHGCLGAFSAETARGYWRFVFSRSNMDAATSAQ